MKWNQVGEIVFEHVFFWTGCIAIVSWWWQKDPNLVIVGVQCLILIWMWRISQGLRTVHKQLRKNKQALRK